MISNPSDPARVEERTERLLASCMVLRPKRLPKPPPPPLAAVL